MPVLLLGVVAGLVVAVRWADHEISKLVALNVDTCLPPAKSWAPAPGELAVLQPDPVLESLGPPQPELSTPLTKRNDALMATEKRDNDILAKDGKKNGWIGKDRRRTDGNRTYECTSCGYYKCRCK